MSDRDEVGTGQGKSPIGTGERRDALREALERLLVNWREIAAALAKQAPQYANNYVLVETKAEARQLTRCADGLAAALAATEKGE